MFVPQFEPLMVRSYADEVHKQIMSGWVGPGKATQAFEDKIRQVTGAKFCLATTSGTAAIMMALRALRLPEASTILFPAYTFIAGANAAKFLGYNVKLVDIKPNTLCMDPKLVSEADAVMFVNHNGYVGEDVQKIRDLCAHIPMIEDSSQTLGMENGGRVGDMGILSFSVPKLVTTGQGGAIITDSNMMYERCRKIRDHGEDWRKTKIHENLGINLKFNDVLASLGTAQLERLDYLLLCRKQVFNAYRNRIELVDFGCESTWMAVYRTQKADEIIRELQKLEIQAVKYYRPINHNPPYQDEQSYPVAEEAWEQLLYLPSGLNLSTSTIDTICKMIKRVEAS